MAPIFTGVHKGPLYLASLLEACSEDTGLFSRALDANGLQDDDAGREVLGKAAVNIYQVLGPLHCRINPMKDVRTFWFEIFIKQFHMRVRGKQSCPANLVMREVASYLEIFMVAYLRLRAQILECLRNPAISFRYEVAMFLCMAKTRCSPNRHRFQV